MRRFLSGTFVAVLLLIAGGSVPIHGQSGYSRVLDGNAGLRTRWGVWEGDVGRATARIGDQVEGDQFHAEAQHAGVVAADFVFGADVTFDGKTQAHLQFRISNEGRYGVAIGTGGVRIYKQVRRVGPTLDAFEMERQADLLSLETLAISDASVRFRANSPHRVKVTADGPALSVMVDGIERLRFTDHAIGVGRFGLYVLGPKDASVRFSNVAAYAAVTAASNFALLYNTVGYEVVGPKRALVRTLSDFPAKWVREPRFQVVTFPEGTVVVDAPLTDGGRSLGMSTWEADFSWWTQPGAYVLRVTMQGHAVREGIPAFRHELVSSPFEIGSNVVTRRMMKSLALLNPEARRAADEDRTRHWKVRSGTFDVTDDGMIVATGDDQYGGVLDRVGSGYGASGPPTALTFTLSAEIAIDSGCDAQLQFQVTPRWRYAVTLQAGSAGGCPRGGPGAVSLHYEDAGGSLELARRALPNFVRGRFYRIVVRVYDYEYGTHADVDVDDVRMLSDVPLGKHPGTFSIKAWSAKARFDRVIAWSSAAEFIVRGGVRIPAVRGADGSMLTCEEGTRVFSKAQRDLVCYPIFAQRHGFHDCNNYIGEGTSHGAFLAGLMDVWARRKETLDTNERGSLLRAAVAAAGYLDELQRTAGFTGEYAHEEPSRGARTGASGYYQVILGLYGDAALAAKGADLDLNLARAACVRASRATTWLLAEEARFALGHHTRFPLTSGEKPWYDNLKSLVYAQLAQCASRDDSTLVLPPMPVDTLKHEATQAALRWLAHLNANLATEPRDPGRVIPWLEGIDEVLRLGSNDDLTTGLNELASKLAPKNSFHVLPQGRVDQWTDQASVPRIAPQAEPKANPPLTWYTVTHFAASATDGAILFRRTGNHHGRKLAAGSLGWILGLNPGIPSTKALHATTGGRPWTAAAFVSNLNAPSARSWEAFMTPATLMKVWLWPREQDDAVHQEPWLVQPKESDFMSLVNGHVIWDGEWDYWNQGEHGWVSGETFLMHDGAFLKAAIAYEDALDGPPILPHDRLPNPDWDATNVTLFHTTLDLRNQTGWGFDNINTVPYAHASRMAQELCRRRGYSGGRLTGHQVDERVGVLCLPIEGSSVFDVNQEKVHATPWSFDNIETVEWAKASRAAERLCEDKGGGFFTGHQIGERRGVVCAGKSAHWFDSTRADVDDSGYPFDDINTVKWPDAARAATNICKKKNYLGGFFNGHQVDDKRGLVCLGPT